MAIIKKYDVPLQQIPKTITLNGNSTDIILLLPESYPEALIDLFWGDFSSILQQVPNEFAENPGTPEEVKNVVERIAMRVELEMLRWVADPYLKAKPTRRLNDDNGDLDV